MDETPHPSTSEINIREGIDPATGKETISAKIKVGDRHISVAPTGDNTGRYEITVWGDNGKGDIDVKNQQFFTTIDAPQGTTNDIVSTMEEIVLTYKSRLEQGIDPNDLDMDERQAREAYFKTFDPDQKREG